MERLIKLFLLLLLLLQFLTVAFVGVSAKPVTFTEGFTVNWADSHVKQIQGGSSIQLILDQSSGSGFVSKNKYLFGRVSMKIKLISGDSAGTVTAFYMNSDNDSVRDELDFEFLGNRSGQPYTVQTNVYANGKGDREQRVNLWFDPAADYHTYSILWNHCHVIFFVDEVPIRVFKNNERRGVSFPKLQPMAVHSTLWEADDWATRGGLEKIDWTKAPFYAYYKEFDIEGCVASPAIAGDVAACASKAGNWWEEPAYCQLSAGQARLYRWVRLHHLIYDYCTDKSRFAITPTECAAGI
ncbi:probable xyloglucan endotransglucosylase/hydrolase protein 6 isoform X2 [Phalaenopsis equestris]|uniref:probable xyloglucan endotransglucosylase/hydrolase protein 6 isoform X2 n=1 Tax=Phalaenopsis equestris TaxID=78828 RepID=UPI0009E251DA|nr:probable xyloglucan endotransglucosylase/hydrolase protein 6 isoform X2 [Phalaenopsis equestris]